MTEFEGPVFSGVRCKICGMDMRLDGYEEEVKSGYHNRCKTQVDLENQYDKVAECCNELRTNKGWLRYEPTQNAICFFDNEYYEYGPKINYCPFCGARLIQ